MNKKLFSILILTLTVIGLGLAYKYHFAIKPNPNELKIYGNVEIRQAYLGFKVAGRIAKLNYMEGDYVKKGDLLAKLETISYEAEKKKTIAEIERLEANKSNAIANYSRRHSLYSKGAISLEQLETYKREVETTTAALDAAQQLAVIAVESVNDTNMYAPDSGYITTRSQEEGSIVGAGTVVYTLALDAPLWVRAYVDEPMLGNIAYGTKAKIITDTLNPATGKKYTYDGHIGYISPVAEFTPKTVQTENQRTDLVYRIRVYVDQKDDFLRQGMPVTVIINTDRVVKNGKK